MKKSPLTQKDMLIMIIKAQGSCFEINSLHCQGAVIGNQRYTACPINCRLRYARRLPLINKEEIYTIAVNKFVEKYGQDALVEALM